MNAIEELVTEHEAVRTTLDILGRICREIEKTGRIPDPGHLEQLLEFFTVFVDTCHHGKEEALLFPALEAMGISREGGPIGVMLWEHQQGRELVGKMRTELSRHREGDPAALPRLRAHAEAYITLLGYHIDKENGVLFPMAEKHLSAEVLAELKSGFDRIETERIGAGRHEAFHQMLSSLARIYLE